MNGGHKKLCIDSIVLCDEVQQRPDGAYDLLGVHTFLQGPGPFPYLHPRLCVFLRVYGPLGRFVAGMVSVWQDGQTSALCQQRIEPFELFGPNVYRSVWVTLDAIAFPVPGVYWIEVRLPGCRAGFHRLEVD
jgi:hypothetical protein